MGKGTSFDLYLQTTMRTSVSNCGLNNLSLCFHFFLLPLIFDLFMKYQAEETWCRCLI